MRIFSSQNAPTESSIRWPAFIGFTLTLVTLLATVPSATTASEVATSQPIVGGADTTSADWPWQVALVYNDPGNDFQNQFCGGSVIDPQWVLTAAHCMFDEFGELTTSDFVIVAGRTDLLDNNGETIAPVAIFVHQEYDNDLEGGTDIALIKLATPTSAQPVSLARNPAALYLAPGQIATVTGWGSTAAYEPENEDPPFEFPSILQEVEVPLQADAVCADWYGSVYDGPTMLCAGGTVEGGTGSCQGDSGGPLVVFDDVSEEWMIAGITSFGGGCAAAEVPSVYTEVAGVLQFIEGHTGPLLPEITPQAYLPFLTRD